MSLSALRYLFPLCTIQTNKVDKFSRMHELYRERESFTFGSNHQIYFSSLILDPFITLPNSLPKRFIYIPIPVYLYLNTKQEKCANVELNELSFKWIPCGAF